MAPVFDFEPHVSSTSGTVTVTVEAAASVVSGGDMPDGSAFLLRTEKKSSAGPWGSRPSTPLKRVPSSNGPLCSPAGSAVDANLIHALAHTRLSPRKGTNVQSGLAKMLAESNASSRAPSDAGDLTTERAVEPKPAPAKKKRNKKGKKSNARGAGVSAAGQEAHGQERPLFLQPKPLRAQTKPPGVMELPDYGDPDWTFLKRPTPAASVASSSRASTPPPRSGLSSLLSQAHPGDLVFARSDTSASSETEDVEPMVAYEVAIDEDYVDKEVDSRPTTRAGSPSAPPRRKMTANDFEPLKCLGKGSFGTVVLVRHKATGRLYAQKQLKKATLIVHKKVVEQTKTERAILEAIRHPFVVKLYYAFQDQEKLYLILEYAQGGELFHHLAETKMFSEDAAAFYIAQLVLALSHLHQNVGVVYRDLKPENCLLDADGHLLLTDFGLSKVRTDENSRCRSLLGTPEYMAPEVLTGDGKQEYGAEVDWWAVGILAHEFLTGSSPFQGNTPEKVKAKIKSGKLSFPFYLSTDAKDIIARLLRKDPQKRLGYNMPRDLDAIKKHRFFRKIDWRRLERRECVPPIRPLVTDPALAENFEDDFTSLPLSPVGGGFVGAQEIARREGANSGAGMRAGGARGGEDEDEDEAENPFAGFSFVASHSLLDQGFMHSDY